MAHNSGQWNSLNQLSEIFPQPLPVAVNPMIAMGTNPQKMCACSGARSLCKWKVTTYREKWNGVVSSNVCTTSSLVWLLMAKCNFLWHGWDLACMIVWTLPCLPGFVVCIYVLGLLKNNSVEENI